MKTLKKHLREENIKSDKLGIIISKYKRKDIAKIALYCAEDLKEECASTVRQWLEKRVPKSTLMLFADDFYRSGYHIEAHVLRITFCKPREVETEIIRVFNRVHEINNYCDDKLEEWKKYALCLAYEDLDFPYKEQAKTFDLDNYIDMNVFLDFLTDNYPDALIFSREEFLYKKLAKEYLKAIYQ